jgi:Vam6/Vps39-like protein vacuolar protein sorting-associated protein 39
MWGLTNVIRYCNHVHLTQDSAVTSPIQSRRGSTTADDEDAPPSIYRTLLSLYLTPPQPHQANWPPALDLLSKHGSRLPASSTLNLIPAALPVAELESYFRGRIRAANSIVNEAKVVAGLRKSEVVSAQASLLLGDGIPDGNGGRNRRVIVSEERVCGVCHKRLGGSVIAVLPDNGVVHYGCLNRANGRSTGGMGSLRTAQWR